MAQLAIKGHPTRGEEVIEILKMFGGANRDFRTGIEDRFVFFIEDGLIVYQNPVLLHNFICYTLEEFLEKFPYKVGDKVRVADYESEVRIDSMLWDGLEIQYQVFTDETEWYSAEELNKYNEIYKKETMDKANKVVFDTNAQCCDISNEIIKK